MYFSFLERLPSIDWDVMRKNNHKMAAKHSYY